MTEWITRDSADEAYHAGLQCCVLAVSYDVRTRQGGSTCKPATAAT
jgi:hypothetical protein